MNQIEITYNDLDRFVVVDKNVIMNNSLSCEARLLYVYLVSHGKGWKIIRNVLIEFLGSDHRVRKATKELKDAGLISISKVFDRATGKVLGDNWKIFSSQNLAPRVDNQHKDENHVYEIPTCGDSPHVADSTRIKNTKGFKNKDLLRSPSATEDHGQVDQLDLIDYFGLDQENQESSREESKQTPFNQQQNPDAQKTIPRSEAPLPKSVEDRFDDFWSQYPIKERKEGCRKEWRKLKLKHSDVDAILHDISKRKMNFERWKTKRFILHPLTYLKDKCWNDEWEAQQATDKPLQPPPRPRSRAEIAEEKQKTSQRHLWELINDGEEVANG